MLLFPFTLIIAMYCKCYIVEKLKVDILWLVQFLSCYADARMEEFVYEKVQGSKPQRMLENDALGQNMIDAGNDFGPGTAYGQSLV